MEDNTNKKAQKWAKNLPQYTPPESSWGEIERKLGQGKVVAFRPQVWWAAAASVVLVLGVLGWLNTQETSSDKITYSEEKLTKLLVINKNDDTARQNARIEAYCEQKANLCQKPEFKNLKQQLDQLNAAHQELKVVVETYNPDPNLVAQFAQIESSRANVLKKLFESI